MIYSIGYQKLNEKRLIEILKTHRVDSGNFGDCEPKIGFTYPCRFGFSDIPGLCAY